MFVLLLLFRIMEGGLVWGVKVPVVKLGGWRPLLCAGDTRQAPRPVGVWGNLTRGLVPLPCGWLGNLTRVTLAVPPCAQSRIAISCAALFKLLHCIEPIS